MKILKSTALFLLPVILINCSGVLSQETIDAKTTHVTFHSAIVKDSFDIYVSLPDNYTTDSSYNVIYYMDANLKSGKAIRTALLKYREQGKPVNAVVVGIGHFRNYRVLRRRDLITPFIPDGKDSLISDEENFGHCEEFYQFLLQELIPHVEKSYRCTQQRSFVGHSLGGLFAFYCLFKKEHLFTNHVSLSPALWINYTNIYQFEKKYHAYSDTLKASIYLCTGTKEIFNKILSGGRAMRDTLEKRNYAQLNFVYKEFKDETHNSEVPKALDMILPKLLNN